MAQLKDTAINGVLEVSDKIIVGTGKDISGIHPTTGEAQSLISMSSSGNTIVGYHGYANRNGNSHIYGEDILHCVASAGNASYRPYYRAGDSVSLNFRGSGYVTNSSQDVTFLVPFASQIIGNPTVTASSVSGLTLRQGTKYTHGSSASTPVSPNSYTTILIKDVGVVVTAKFTTTTNATNNDATGIYWSGQITFS